MARRVRVITIAWFLSFSALAGTHLPITISDEPVCQERRWSLVASLGYSDYQNMYRDEGQTAIGRMAIATELLTTKKGTFGVEAGIQNGNRMHLALPKNVPDEFDALTLQSTVKPMLDFLLTANTDLLGASLFFAQFKGGIAYRQWLMDSDLINNKSELAGEVQAGLGCPITEITSLNLLYQGVFGANPNFRVNPLTKTGHVSNVPIQHGVLLGLSVTA